MFNLTFTWTQPETLKNKEDTALFENTTFG